LDAYKNGVCDDMIFAPIYIGYDRVLEEGAYLHELEGGQKKPESFWQVLKARKFLKRRYGKIYIQFHEPLSLKDILNQQGTSLSEMKPKEKNAFCRNLGHRVINSINKKTVVTPHGLVASALLNFAKKTGFITPRTQKLASKAKKAGAIGTAQNMVGEAIHTLTVQENSKKIVKAFQKVLPKEKIVISKIDFQGARLV
jgi:glycerol-3-phosphate O-acyltransferase